MVERLLYLKARVLGALSRFKDEASYRLRLTFMFITTQEPSTYRGIAMLLGGGLGALTADEWSTTFIGIAGIVSGLVGIFTHDRATGYVIRVEEPKPPKKAVKK